MQSQLADRKINLLFLPYTANLNYMIGIHTVSTPRNISASFA
jgi:hypothetical protein